MKSMLGMLVLFVAAAAILPSPVKAADEAVRQPVFLICPHKENKSAWSLFLKVDKTDPSKVLYLGLEALDKVNSVQSNGYEAVLEAQKKDSTPRTELLKLNASEFGRGEIKVEQNSALNVSVAPNADGSMKLNISMRRTSDKRFNFGGKDAAKRDLVLKYNKDKKEWGAFAAKLEDAEGGKISEGGTQQMTGIQFPITGTGIYRIVGWMADGESHKLLDD
jgi:hypothetical protein